MSLKKQLDKAFGKDKVELHLPRAPIKQKDTISGETPNTSFKGGGSIPQHPTNTDSKPIIDFSYLTSNSSFQRAIMEFIKKFVPGFENVEARGSKEVMVKSFDSNAQNYRECMAELKEKLLKRKRS